MSFLLTRAWRAARNARPGNVSGWRSTLSMGQQGPARRIGEHAQRRAAQDKLAHPRMAVSAHHQQIDLVFRHVGFERLADGLVAAFFDRIDLDVDAMAAQVPGEIDAGAEGLELLVVLDAE